MNLNKYILKTLKTFLNKFSISLKIEIKINLF